MKMPSPGPLTPTMALFGVRSSRALLMIAFFRIMKSPETYDMTLTTQDSIGAVLQESQVF